MHAGYRYDASVSTATRISADGQYAAHVAEGTAGVSLRSVSGEEKTLPVTGFSLHASLGIGWFDDVLLLLWSAGSGVAVAQGFDADGQERFSWFGNTVYDGEHEGGPLVLAAFGPPDEGGCELVGVRSAPFRHARIRVEEDLERVVFRDGVAYARLRGDDGSTRDEPILEAL